MPTFSSKQEIFNHIYLNMVRQGRPAVDEETGICMTKDKYGNKCSLGWLVPDDKFDSNTEGLSFVDFLVKEDIVPSAKVDYIFLGALQTAHDKHPLTGIDGITWLEGFKNRMEGIARLYSLKMPAEEKTTA